MRFVGIGFGVLALTALWTVPVSAQVDSGYLVGSGQAAVLNSINRENAKRLHKEAGLPPPDFDAAQRRLGTQNQASGAPHRLSPEEKARKCGFIRQHWSQLSANQQAMINRKCP